MGYLLPIQPIQSQQYANRMENSTTSFAYIDKVESAKLQSDYEDWQKRIRREQQQQQQQQRDKNTERDMEDAEVDSVRLSPAKNGFIQPNPVHLSKQIALVVGKGNAVNEYV